MHLRRDLFVCMGLSCVLAAASASAQAPGQNTRPLTVDRDPSPSIDPDNAQAATPGNAPGTTAVGPVGKDDTGRYTLQANAFEIQLHVTVLDASGRAANNLQKGAFTLLEDGVPQNITGFRHEDLPVSIGLLIDNSASMWDKRDAVDKAALDLVRLSNPKDEAFLVDFTSKAYIDQELTTSTDQLQNSLRYVKQAGGTAAFDAISVSAQYLNRYSKNTKQVLLLVTDGEDNASRTSMAEMIRRVQGLDGPVIYCVGLLFGDDTTKAESKQARAELEQIADQTGGAAFFPKSIKDVDKIAAIVAEDIRTQYTIGYSSTNPLSNGGYRAVHVEAVGPDGKQLNVRTRNGYFAKSSNPTPTPVPVAANQTAPPPNAK